MHVAALVHDHDLHGQVQRARVVRQRAVLVDVLRGVQHAAALCARQQRQRDAAVRSQVVQDRAHRVQQHLGDVGVKANVGVDRGDLVLELGREADDEGAQQLVGDERREVGPVGRVDHDDDLDLAVVDDGDAVGRELDVRHAHAGALNGEVDHGGDDGAEDVGLHVCAGELFEEQRSAAGGHDHDLLQHPRSGEHTRSGGSNGSEQSRESNSEALGAGEALSEVTTEARC